MANYSLKIQLKLKQVPKLQTELEYICKFTTDNN
jgi:hypothetical protein